MTLKQLLSDFDDNFHHEEDTNGVPCEYLVGNEDGKCNCQIGEARELLTKAYQEGQAARENKKVLRLAKRADKVLQQYENLPPSSSSFKWIEVINIFDDLINEVFILTQPEKDTL